jgi:SPX domain protein involved in polyphosphate accumulation
VGLRRVLSPFVEMDDNAKNEAGKYTVHSIYYDTFELDFYYQKEAGIQHRKKIRIRGYNREKRDSIIFVEIKRKNNMLISKYRAPSLFKNIQSLFVSGDVEQYVITGNGNPYAIEDARRFFFHIYRHSLQPTILIHYEREAFFSKFNPYLRITLDRNIRSSAYPNLEDLFRDEGTIHAMPKYFVLEIKFHDGISYVPVWLNSILEDFDLNKMAISKYKICLDSHHIPKRAYKGSTVSMFRSHKFIS